MQGCSSCFKQRCTVNGSNIRKWSAAIHNETDQRKDHYAVNCHTSSRCRSVPTASKLPYSLNNVCRAYNAHSHLSMLQLVSMLNTTQSLIYVTISLYAKHYTQSLIYVIQLFSMLKLHRPTCSNNNRSNESYLVKFVQIQICGKCSTFRIKSRSARKCLRKI